MHSKVTLVILFLILAVSVSNGQQIREPAYYEGAKYDSVYWNPAYRDSVANYAYRLNAYRFEILNYDLGFSLSMLPVAGQWYVDNTAKGIVYSSIRAGALAVSGIGVAGLFTAGKTWRDVGMVVGGLIVYGVLKWLDITDVQHAISHNNERIVDKFSIELEDVQPTSIRYPQKGGWPDWVTEPPPARESQPHRDIFDRPLPTESQFSIGVGVPF